MPSSKSDPTKSVRVIDEKEKPVKEEVAQTVDQLILNFIYLVFNKIIRLFKAICQILVIFYEFLCLLYQYPNCASYAFEVSYNSLLTCYQLGIWDPFQKKVPKKVVSPSVSTPPGSYKKGYSPRPVTTPPLTPVQSKRVSATSSKKSI